VGILLELLFCVVVILALNVLAIGLNLSISPLEILLWGGGGVVVLVAVVHWLTKTFMAGWTGGPRRHVSPLTAAGLVHLRRGEMEDAERLLRQSLEKNPSEVEAARGLADIALRRSDGRQYVQITSQLLGRPGLLRRSERVTLCHRQADVCLQQLNDPAQAVEALARIELDYPGTTDAVRARQRIERILSG